MHTKNATGSDIITPGTSTVAKFKTEFENLRDSDTSRTKRDKRLLYVRPLFPTHSPHHELCLTLPGVSYLAISVKERVLRWNYGQETESPIANLNIFS